MTKSSPRIAIFPASFDPITIGHLDIISRAAKMFDKLIVLVANNYAKTYLLTLTQRLELVKLAINELEQTNIECVASDRLLIEEFAQYQACCVVRGVRNYQDFEYEVNLAHINSELFGIANLPSQEGQPTLNSLSNTWFETMYLVASPNLKHISSSLIRELSKTEANFEKYAVNFLPAATISLVHKHLFKALK